MNVLSYNAKLVFASPADKQGVLLALEKQREAWNACSKVRFAMNKNSIVELHHLFYRKFRESQPEIPSQVVISAEKDVLSTYQAVRTNKVCLKEPPIKEKLSIRLDKRTFSYKNGVFSLITLGKRAKAQPLLYPRLEKLLKAYPFCDPLLFEKEGEVWISLSFRLPETVCEKSLAVGIDLGCRVAAATSEGNLFIDKKFGKEKRNLRFRKRKMQAAAARNSKAKRRLWKVRHKEANKNRNFVHNLANKLLCSTKANVLAMENLKSIKVKKDHKSKNRVSQASWFELKRILTYKAPLWGKTVTEVSPSYTSQTDSQSGKREGERRGRRFYSLSGKIYDSDINAAINIAKLSKLPVSLGPFGAGTYGQATVNWPIVGAVACKPPNLFGGI